MYDEHLWKPSQASISSKMQVLSKHWFHFCKESYHYGSVLKKNAAAFYEKCIAIAGDMFSHKSLSFLDTCNFIIHLNKPDI